jgi:hypothetical protein
MTVNEIAEVVGKKERTVHGWIKTISAKNAQISAKIAEARATSKPADYTQEETLAIIKEGMGEVPAGVYKAATDTAPKTPAVSERMLQQVRLSVRDNLLTREEGRHILDVEKITKPVPYTIDLGWLHKSSYAVEMKERETARNKRIEYTNQQKLDL